MRSQKISLIVVPILLSACSGEKLLYQDVYNNQYSCSQDWDRQLCDQQNTSSYNVASSSSALFIGPQYYKSVKKVRYQGRVWVRKGNRSNGAPLVSTEIIVGAKSSPIRGGFGRFTSSSGG